MQKWIGLFLVAVSIQNMAARVDYDFPPPDKLPIQEGMPDPFLMPNGTRVKTRADWEKQRKYIKSMLFHYLYGQVPPLPETFELKHVSSRKVYENKGFRDHFELTLRRNGQSVTCRFVVVRPVENKQYPTVIKNDRVAFNEVFEDFDPGRIAVERGYLLCRFHREDLASDVRGSGREAGIYPLYPEYDWAALAVWGWAHGVMLDALNQLGLVDMDKVVATGHSRGGKAALCAGILDERITLTAPNSSGTGGTGSYRYFEEGQRPQTITEHIGKYNRWFHPRYLEFAGKEERMPFDSHFARALIAPRAFLNCHARQDYWANPYGTELTHRATMVVFNWLGAEDKIGLHWREGDHAQNEEDWNALYDFADLQFFGKPTSLSFNTWTYPEAKLPFTWSAPPSLR
ncbi:MAG: hypothetical protein KJT03_05105 [Verrucomicrobiae bacterium]|nr:hypothetical protein [Verrucomicrobiae bacterium]